MAIEIKTWEIINGQLKQIDTTLVDNGRKEKEHLEEWIKTSPKIIGEDIFIIGEQVQTKSGFLDFLGIDKNGNTVIVELKRDKLPREVIAQSIDYASDVGSWDLNKLSEICLSYAGQDLLDSLSEQFDEFNLEEVVINNNQRLLIVGFGIDESTSRMIEWLSSNFNMSINAIILNYSKTSTNTEILSRTVIIPEEIEIQKANKKKFTIARSDIPGNYDKEKLKELVKKYLTKNLHSSRRLKEFILPFLLSVKVATRSEILKELVRQGEAEDERQAGYFMSLVSSQLGHEWKDYLRQIIEYSYPKYEWEKDNFKIRDGYIELVQEILSELKA
ncbi:MAG: endonuclease NucS domain-containing protein [Synechococcus sp.]|nr:endonuclease NucS domain-containing protein [Synechococcus sp.]